MEKMDIKDDGVNQEKLKIPRFTGGPHNVGDPDDKSLRHVERDNCVTQIIQNRTKMLKCYGPMRHFLECARDNQQWMGFKFLIACRPERNILNDCLVRWYYDPEWVQENTHFYLDKRTYFRRNGTCDGWVYDRDRERKDNYKKEETC